MKKATVQPSPGGGSAPPAREFFPFTVLTRQQPPGRPCGRFRMFSGAGMKKLATCLIAVAGLIGTPAFAADMAVKAPPPAPAPVFSWTGFYIGGNAGWGWEQSRSVNFSDTVGPLVAFLGVPAPISFDASGAVGGFQLGYNWQFNQAWLIGLETDFDFSDIGGNGTSNNLSALFAAPLMSTANEKVEWFGTARGRLGYLLTNNLLLYGTAGYAYGKVKQSVQYSNASAISFVELDGSCLAGAVCYTGTSDRVASGWTAGAGFEYALLNSWTFKVEYLYVNLGGNTFNEGAFVAGFLGAAPTSSLTAHYNDTTFQVVRGGFNYKF
jgi:outer membrane immunogenic protein